MRRVGDELAEDTDAAQGLLDRAFERFEASQPQLAHEVSELLGKPLDETALALGYFLTIAVYLAFDRSFGERLAVVTKEAIVASDAALGLEEELRSEHAEEPVEFDDVVMALQPAVMGFVNEHVEAALDVTRGDDEAETDDAEAADIDDVHKVYRMVLLVTLALSHAVRAPSGTKDTGAEILA